MGHQESKMAKFFLLLCLMAAMAYAASDVESFDHAEHGEASDMIQLREENARLKAENKELKEANSVTSPSPKKVLGESSGNNAGLIIPAGCSASDDRCYEQYTGKACSTSGSSYNMATAKARCSDDNDCHGFRADGSGYKLCTNPRQDWSSTNGSNRRRATTYAKQGPLNSAKCAGPAQDHRAVTGTLDCSYGGGDGGNPPIPRGSRQDEQCPDNVSNGKYLMINLSGVISCKPLGTDGEPPFSITRQATNVQPEHDGQYAFKNKDWPSSHKAAVGGCTTKVAVAHPHFAEKNVGVVVFKRLRCTGGEGTNSPPVCSVFKTAQCIKNSSRRRGNIFAEWGEGLATEKELKAFAAVAANAYDNPGTHYAKIKDANKCSDEDARKAAAFVRAF